MTLRMAILRRHRRLADMSTANTNMKTMTPHSTPMTKGTDDDFGANFQSHPETYYAHLTRSKSRPWTDRSTERTGRPRLHTATSPAETPSFLPDGGPAEN